MKAGDMVKINDTSDWNGMYGIIDKIDGEIAFVYCVQRPYQLHPVFLKNLIIEGFEI